MKFTEKWIALEKQIIVNEIIQIQQDKYCMFSFICRCYLLSFQDVCYSLNNYRGLGTEKGTGSWGGSFKEGEIEYSIIKIQRGKKLELNMEGKWQKGVKEGINK